MLLVVIPGSAFVVSLLTSSGGGFYAMSFAASQAALYLPATILACLTALAARRSGRDRSADEAGAGGAEGS